MLPNAEMGLHCLNNTVIEEGIFEIRNDKFPNSTLPICYPPSSDYVPLFTIVCSKTFHF